MDNKFDYPGIVLIVILIIISVFVEGLLWLLKPYDKSLVRTSEIKHISQCAADATCMIQLEDDTWCITEFPIWGMKYSYYEDRSHLGCWKDDN